MADQHEKPDLMAAPQERSDVLASKRLRRRYRQDAVFKYAGLLAVLLTLAMLFWLLSSIFIKGHSAFFQNQLQIEVSFDQDLLDPDRTGDPAIMRQGDYRKLVENALQKRFPEVQTAEETKHLFALVSQSGAPDALRRLVLQDPSRLGQAEWVKVPVSDSIDQLLKGRLEVGRNNVIVGLTDQQIAWANSLAASGEIEARFNFGFLTGTDSPDPELAGIGSALMGSLLALMIVFLIAIPVGIGAALYLEEFAPKNLFTDFIELNINNLAAIPSIIFGLLGLAVFLNIFGVPRSAPLVAGLVLSLMTLPTIIIATRGALRAVPDSIIDGALSLGASRMQAVFHQKLPVATPGILTGSILGVAQALGETAPLLLIGMVAFVTSVPSSVTEPATALSIQIFLWSDSLEPAWTERAAAATIVLLAVLLSMNALAIFLRSRSEKTW